MRKPSLKNKRFVKKFLETGNQTEAYVQVYGTKDRKMAGAMATHMMKRPVVQNYLQELLDEHGLSDDKIAHRLSKIVNAGTRRAALRDTTPQTALEAIKFAAKLKDIVPAQRVEQKTATLNLDLNSKSEEELQQTLSHLSDEIASFRKKFK